MENKRKMTAVAVRLIEADGRITCMRLDFANGRQLVVAEDQVPNSVRAYAAWHGLKQKLVDAAALSRDPETGRSATPDDKYTAVKAVYDRLMRGEWNATSGGGGTGGGGGGLLYRALVRLYPGRDAAAIREYLAGLDAKQQAALRGNPKIAAVIADIRAEDDARKGADVGDDPLAELEQMFGGEDA